MNLVKKIGLPISILLVGFAGFKLLASMGTTAQQEVAPREPTQVGVTQLTATAQPAKVFGTGTVRAAKSVLLTPSVSGVVTYTAPELMPGGRFEKGDLLAKIDKTTYTAALANAQAKLAAAVLNHELESGRLETANREWALLGREGESTELASRKLHMQVAKAELEAATSAVAMAKRDLKYTSIRAPFDGVLTNKSIDIGQVVGLGTPIGSLLGSDKLWVEVSVPVAQLQQLTLPGSTALATTVLSTGNTVARKGIALRAVGQLDPTTTSATVLVELAGSYDTEPPMLPGSLVNVALEGDPVPGVHTISRDALSAPNTIWTVVNDALLGVQVDVLWGDPLTVSVLGLPNDVSVVTSPLRNPVNGTAVRVTN
jgi:RND family efflux transporter MFP subunit